MNNQYRGYDISSYQTEFRELLKTALSLAGNDTSRVFVVSIPDYSYTPSHTNIEGIREEIDAYNSINRKVALDAGVMYFDITPVSRLGLEIPSYVAGDALHPSGVQYKEWVKLILQEVEVQLASGIERIEEDSSLNCMLVKGKLHIDLPGAGGVLVLVNNEGRIIRKFSIPGQEVQFAVNDFTPGLYIINYVFDDKNFTRKVFIN